MSDPFAGTSGSPANPADTGSAESYADMMKRYTFWSTAEDYYDKAGNWASSLPEKALDKYSKTDFSAKVDKGLAAVEEPAKKVKAAAEAYMGYLSDPEKLDSLLKTAAVIVVVLGIVYVIATFAPLIPRGAR